MSENTAKFAVVGHPNKGKSSIVSTLSHNESIRISSQSGTTKKSAGFHVDNNDCGYELIDTPGFQRPRKVLTWLKQKAPSAEMRSKAVADFVDDLQCQRDFPDEVELLKPLVDGAAILYVVDGSRPYGPEYEAEMEILRWSGQPSMALINPIENTLHVKPWKNALEQYFKMVSVFNPMEAEFTKQIDLLKAFAMLKPSWAEHLEQVMYDLNDSRQQQKLNSAIILSRLVEDLCFYQESQKVLTEHQAEVIRPLLEKKYFNWMMKREQKAINELLANYKHSQTKLSMDELSLPPDLFDCEKWYLWGLSKNQLAVVSAMVGVAVGASVDLAVAGASFMTGAISGGVIGFTSAWLGADKLASFDIKGLPLDGFEVNYGPINNKNFPYVVIGRFIYLYQQISERNHAKREALEIETNELHQQIANLEKSSQKFLHQICDKLVKQKTIDIEKFQQTLLLLL